ncbi:endonuclease/exonuclease/phosphatase family protein [Spongorhabdus nitratireducens]
MTWNIQMALGKHYVTFWKRNTKLPSRKEVENNIQSIIDLINQYSPDIIMLQEVSEYACVSRYADVLGTLKSELIGYPYCCSTYYWNTHYLPILCYGSISGPMDFSLVIFSKHEILSHDIYPIFNDHKSWVHRMMAPVRLLLQANIQIGENNLTVVTTHFDAHDLDGQTRKRQQHDLTAHLQNLNHWNFAWVMGGDLNLVPPGSPEYIAGTRRFTLDLYDEEGIEIFPDRRHATHTEAAWHYATAHESPPEQDIKLNLTLDYLMVSSRYLKVVQKQVVHNPVYSDHCPVIIDCEFIQK